LVSSCGPFKGALLSDDEEGRLIVVWMLEVGGCWNGRVGKEGWRLLLRGGSRFEVVGRLEVLAVLVIVVVVEARGWRLLGGWRMLLALVA
jgi:hypothetical protein